MKSDEFSTIFTTFANLLLLWKWNKTKQNKIKMTTTLTNFLEWTERAAKDEEKKKCHSVKGNWRSVVNKYKRKIEETEKKGGGQKQKTKRNETKCEKVFAKCHIGKLFEFYFFLLCCSHFHSSFMCGGRERRYTKQKNV